MERERGKRRGSGRGGGRGRGRGREKREKEKNEREREWGHDKSMEVNGIRIMDLQFFFIISFSTPNNIC